jgi:hypothetical protein
MLRVNHHSVVVQLCHTHERVGYEQARHLGDAGGSEVVSPGPNEDRPSKAARALNPDDMAVRRPLAPGDVQLARGDAGSAAGRGSFRTDRILTIRADGDCRLDASGGQAGHAVTRSGFFEETANRFGGRGKVEIGQLSRHAGICINASI